MKNVLIGEKEIGDSCPCFIIAEMGLSHDGSLGSAYAFIDAASDSGVDAVKFQTHMAEFESSKYEQFRKSTFFPQDKTRFKYWKRTAFSELQWKKLKEYAEAKGLVFLSSPFCEEAVEMLLRIGIKAFKISSGEACNLPMLQKILDTKLPIILSTGMLFMDEIENIVSMCKQKEVPLIVCQCTTSYPCPPERLGLNIIKEFKDLFNIPIGFSDHSGKIYSGLASRVVGADLLEVHVCFSKKCFGPDVSSSITFEELKELVDGIRFIDSALNAPLAKDIESQRTNDLRKIFAKGIYASKNISKNAIIKRDDICFKKPLIGIPAGDFESVLGKVSLREIKKGEYIKYEDIDDGFKKTENL